MAPFFFVVYTVAAKKTPKWTELPKRWVGDKPKRLLLKPESLDGFRRLTDGLRLCCLHFHNHACPQDLEDTQ